MNCDLRMVWCGNSAEESLRLGSGITWSLLRVANQNPRVFMEEDYSILSRLVVLLVPLYDHATLPSSCCLTLQVFPKRFLQ